MEVLPIPGLPEIEPGCDLPRLICGAAAAAGLRLEDGDVLVVASKAVAKWRGCVVRPEDVTPGPRARGISPILNKSPAYCQIVLDQTREIVRLAPGVLITRTRHGFVLANAGVDASNTARPGEYVVLPEDLDGLARRLRGALAALCQKAPAVIISDTFGRPWRNGQTDLAVGCAGLSPLLDLRGRRDDIGQSLRCTMTAVADELAAAADLVSGKTGRIPAVLIRGYACPAGEEGAAALVMPRERDLFGPDPAGGCALAALLLRRSVRRFARREIPGVLLSQVLAAGDRAPSAHNAKPWHFCAVSDPARRRAFCGALAQRHRRDMERSGFSPERIEAKLARSRDTLGTAGAYIVLFARQAVPDNPLAENGEAERLLTAQSVALAGGQMLLAAAFLGLGACWYAAPLFCADLVRELCAAPEGYTPQGMIALGYPAPDADLPPAGGEAR